MEIRPTNDADIEVFRRGCAGDRVEEWTCRPVKDGRPESPDPRRRDWTFEVAGEAAGWVSLFDLNPRNRSAEFGYGIVRPLRGKRLGKTMLTRAFERFYREHDLNKLYCQTASFNTASIRLLESLGLTRDGILRAHHERDGVFHDEYIYSLLRAEWLARSPH